MSPGSRPRRPTLLDVATAAGVSRATASLVLRETGNLTDATRERVRAAMADLGYVYHRGAAALRVGASRTVGLIAPASANLFMSELTSAFELDLLDQGLITLVCHSYDDVDRQAVLIRSLLERGVDAMAIVPAVGSTDSLRGLLSSIDVPLVLASRPLRGLDLDFVGPDNVWGARLAARHLVEHQVETVAYLGGPDGLEVRADRLAGLTAELTDADPAIRLVADLPGPLDAASGIAALETLAERGPLPDALVCHNETIAFGAYRVLRDRFPDRVATTCVIAFDDVDVAALWEPPLTTVATSARELGRTAARLVTNPAGDGVRRTEMITPRLVVRRSCGCP